MVTFPAPFKQLDSSGPAWMGKTRNGDGGFRKVLCKLCMLGSTGIAAAGKPGMCVGSSTGDVAGVSLESVAADLS